MLFSVLGSCIGGDIITKAPTDWQVLSNFVSYSPYAMILGKDNKLNLRVDKKDFPNETDDHIKKVNNFLSGNIFQKLNKAEWLIADLSDFRISSVVLNFDNGNKFYLTNGILSSDNLFKLGEMIAQEWNTKLVRRIDKISLNDVSDEQLEVSLKSFLNSLYENFDKNRIIFIKPKLACQYLNEDTIEYTPNFAITGETNDMIDRVYGIASKYINFLEPPKNIIGDKNCMRPFEYHFCQPYYNYMIKGLKYIISGESIDCAIEKIKQNCEEEIDSLINTIFCKNLLKTIELHINKKIILIAKNKMFETLLTKKYNKKIYEFIKYDESANINEIEEKVMKLKGGDLIFVIPEMFNHGEERSIVSLFYRQYLIYGIDFFVYIPKSITLEKFVGKFSDCYHNSIYVKQGTPINIILNGCANNVFVDRQKRFFTISLMSGNNISIGHNCMLSGKIVHGWDAKTTIGKLTTISAQADIAVHSFSTLIIGEDCMFSFSNIIYTGDGHPIFIKDNGQFKHINPCMEDKIEIGSHVWVGHSSKLLSKAKIGDGSIVGMGSLVNKEFPNNVLIVGSPAKIIKKNVSWIRNVLIREIERDVGVYNIYANETVE